MTSIKRICYRIKNISLFNKNTEKLLIMLSLSLIVVLIISQIGLMNDTARTILTGIDSYEGLDISEIDNLSDYVQLKLKLVDEKPSSKIKILINGHDRYVFDKGIITINVRNKSLVEIDGTEINNPFTVEIIETNNDIISNLKSKRISVNSNIEILARIFLK